MVLLVAGWGLILLISLGGTLWEEGGAFQFSETYSGPGLTQHTVIVRETDIEQLTETTSTFSQ